MGSSTNHVVRFDGLALRLDGEGLCTYTLLTVSRSSGEGSEVKLHSGPCKNSENYNQVCMTAMEVIHGPRKLLLKDDMTVRLACSTSEFLSESLNGCLLTLSMFEQALINGEAISLPWRYAGLELVHYGGVMLQLKSDHGYVLSFTPQSNEFTITMSSPTTTGHTAGLCGNIMKA